MPDGNTLSVRLQLQGGDDVRKQLQAVGDAGDKALGSIPKAAQLSEAAFQRFVNSIDPAAKAQQKLADGTALLNARLDQGKISATEHARLVDLLTQRWTAGSKAVNDNSAAFSASTNAFRLNRGGMLELQAAGVNAFQALASGMSATRVASMEGAQVLGALIQGGVIGFKSLVSPVGLAATAVVGLGAAFLLLRDNTVDTTLAEESFRDAIKASNEELEASAQKAARLARERKGDAVLSVSGALISSESDQQSAEKKIKALRDQLDGIRQLGPGYESEIKDLETRIAVLGITADASAARVDELKKRLADLANPAKGADFFARQDELNKELDQEDQDRQKAEKKRRDEAAAAAKKAAEDAARADERLFKSTVDQLAGKDEAKNSLDALIDKIREETTQLGLNDKERSQRVELMKAEEIARKGGITLSDDFIAKLKEEVTARDKAKESTQQQKALSQELDRFATSSFDRIGQAVTQMAVEGKDAFQDLRNVGAAVVSELAQEFIKLAAINPLKNALFGDQKNPTLADAGGLLGKLFGGSAGGGFDFGGSGFGAQLLATDTGATGASFASEFAAGIIPMARGGTFRSADLSRHSGSIVDRPTFFRFASGGGVMGEAGPEAILPLKRGADGKLGIAAGGDRGGDTFNVNFAIDARGADADAANRLAAVANVIVQKSVAAMQDAQRRNRRVT